LTVWIFLLYSI